MTVQPTVATTHRRRRPKPRALGWLGVCFLVVPSAFAGGSSRAEPTIRQAVEVRSILTGEFGFPRPAGLAYVQKGNVIFVAMTERTGTRILRLSPYERAKGRLMLPRLARPSTLSFDPVNARLMAVSKQTLVTVKSSALGKRKPPVVSTDITRLGLRKPQAAAFDTGDRRLLVLDTGAREIVRVSLSSPQGTKPTRISLRGLKVGPLRGLAYNPADRLVYVAAPDRHLLYGLDRAGRVRKTFSLGSVALESLTGLAFAPSTDPTDAPTVRHLFASDAGSEKALGRVVELSLAQSVALPATVTGKLVRTIHTSRLDPPSPDPSGITYVAATDTLFVVDSEVDETSIYRGANLFRMRRTGTLVSTGTTLAFSREPTGVGFDPSSRTLFLSDDNKRTVFIDRPGSDGLHGTADDSVTRMSTAAFGSLDPEDVDFDLESGHLFVADGVGAEIYDVDPVNEVFGDGDDEVTHFDVATYGARNCEGIGYDPRRKTLLVIADHERRILELTRTGGLVRIINLATIPGTRWLSGITVAPTSNPNDSPNAMSYWVTDRQVDNNANPKENDGKIYEIVAP